MERENEVYICKLAEQAERYEDMVDSIKKVCEINADLSLDERNLLSAGYKYMVAPRRSSWRVLSATERKELEQNGGNAGHLNLIRASLQKVEAEVEDICTDAVKVIDSFLLPAARDAEAVVFYYKMKGDYYRYLAEIKVGEAKQIISDESVKAYEEALGRANELTSTHPIRLGLALNYSVFYYEIQNNAEKACQLAKVAFEEAVSELDSLSEDSYKDSTLIMQLLRDNLTLWSTEEEGEKLLGEHKEPNGSSSVQHV